MTSPKTKFHDLLKAATKPKTPPKDRNIQYRSTEVQPRIIYWDHQGLLIWDKGLQFILKCCWMKCKPLCGQMLANGLHWTVVLNIHLLYWHICSKIVISNTDWNFRAVWQLCWYIIDIWLNQSLDNLAPNIAIHCYSK